MNKCVHEECQFYEFFKNKNISYKIDNNTEDKYCLFHAPESLKETFSYQENEKFQIYIDEYMSNEDFIATDNTPNFLIIENDYDSSIEDYKYQMYLDENDNCRKRIYKLRTLLPQCLEKSNHGVCNQVNVGERFIVQFLYSAHQFISPFTNKNKSWFKTVSPKTSLLNIIETILLYLFFGAFILALKNRIKR